MFIDTHAHILSSFYPEGIEAVIRASLDKKIVKIINIATCPEEFSQVLSLAQSNPGILLPSLGIHPDIAHGKDLQGLQTDIEALANESAAHTLLSIGECGLDYKGIIEKERDNIGEPVKIKQKYLFEKQAMLALALDIPLIIHCREAIMDLLPLLQTLKTKYPQLRAVIHSLDVSMENAIAIINLGFFVSFNGIMTFKNAKSIQELSYTLPLDRIILETDSPFLSPTPYRGTKNQPANIIYIYEYFAKLRNISLLQLQSQIISNEIFLWGESFCIE